MAQPSVALLGLGIMGSRMARRLLAAGFPLAVYNRTRDRAAPLGQAGARVAEAPAAAVSGADIAFSMVTDDAASRDVWLGRDGALAAAPTGAVLVESSTLTVTWVRELAAEVAARGCEFVDAPVTGSRDQAGSGELNFLVGGSTVALERIRPALSAMARSITHLGPVGSGALIKLINNFVCGAQIVSFAEGLAMVEGSGLDRDQAVDVLLNECAGQSDPEDRRRSHDGVGLHPELHAAPARQGSRLRHC